MIALKVILISKDLKDQILGNLVRAVELLRNCEALGEFVPEVRMNIAFALPNAQSINDVAAIPGRISVYRNILIINNLPAFGASDHLARAIIEAQKYEPTIRAAINFKYTKELREWLEKNAATMGLNLVCVDRSEEPTTVSSIDGHSMPWKIKKAIDLAKGKFPDLVGETEAPGKEPLFKLFGKTATDVAEKLVKIANAWANRTQ
ncbi:MAG: thiamine-phosphate synthase family protein [Candidatus Helarchaeota archaeon]